METAQGEVQNGGLVTNANPPDVIKDGGGREARTADKSVESLDV